MDDRSALTSLMVRLRDGDRAASGPVFSALWPVCLRLAQRALGNEADAHDAAQKALVTLFRDATRYNPKHSALAWALTLTTWECRTIRQAQRRRRIDVAADTSAVAADAIAADVALERAADVAALVEGLVALSDDDQASLRAMLDGDAAGAPTARKRRSRALARLKALVMPRAPTLKAASPSLPGDDHG